MDPERRYRFRGSMLKEAINHHERYGNKAPEDIQAAADEALWLADLIGGMNHE